MENLIQIKIICSSISLTTSTTVAILFILNKKLRTPTFRLVLQLQIADALFAIASLINSNDENNSLCQFQAFMVNYSRESSIIWIAIFAYNMYATIVDNLLIPGLLKFYVIAIGIPLVLSVYPFFGDAYGFNYSMCWIEPNRTMYIVLNYFVFCICILFYIIIFYIKTFNFLNEVTEIKSYKLFLYPFAFFITQIWTMIDILQQYDENSSLIFKSIAITFISLQGFINSLVYGLTPQVLEILKSLFVKNKVEQEIQITSNQQHDLSRQESFIVPIGMVGLDSRTASNTSAQEAHYIQQQMIAIKQQQEL